MPHIALTGGIACGKSLAAKMLNDLGVETLDADDVVHELLPDPAERRRIAAEVFADPAKRRALERELHPQVRARLFAWLDEPRAASAPPRVAVIPLIYEAGWEGDFSLVGCVASSRETWAPRRTAANRREGRARRLRHPQRRLRRGPPRRSPRLCRNYPGIQHTRRKKWYNSRYAERSRVMMRGAKHVLALTLVVAGASALAYNGGYENHYIDEMAGYTGYGNDDIMYAEPFPNAAKNQVFAQCRAATSLNLSGQSVSEIGNASFAYMGITALTIPSCVQSVGYISFGGCSNLGGRHCAHRGQGAVPRLLQAQDPPRLRRRRGAADVVRRHRDLHRAHHRLLPCVEGLALADGVSFAHRHRRLAKQHARTSARRRPHCLHRRQRL